MALLTDSAWGDPLLLSAMERGLIARRPLESISIGMRACFDGAVGMEPAHFLSPAVLSLHSIPKESEPYIAVPIIYVSMTHDGILIDTYNRMRRNGLDATAAALETGRRRLRPVLRTALTTVLGLMPMVLAMNIDILNRAVTFGAPSTQWWTQLASAIAVAMTQGGSCKMHRQIVPKTGQDSV